MSAIGAGRVPRGRREHASWLVTLTVDGIGERVEVPGAVDRAAFDAFGEQQLAPALREGQVVVLANLSAPKRDDARDAVEAAGCRLVFLPTYSTDFNPIAQACATCKAAIRRAEPRDFGAAVAAVGAALTAVTPEDATAFFRAAGYPA